MKGVLPYVYKYASVLLNLTSYNIKKRGVNPYNNEKKKNTVINDLVHNLELAKKLHHNYKLHIPSIKEIIDGIESNEIRENAGPDDPLHDHTDDGKSEKVDAKKKKIKEKTQKLSTKIEDMSKELIALCKSIIEDIERKYKGTKFLSELVQFKHMSREEFSDSV